VEHGGDAERVAAVVAQLAPRPAVVRARRCEAAGEQALGLVGEQHHAPLVVEELGELRQPGRAEVLGLVDDHDVEALGHARPMAQEMTDGDEVPPLGVGVVGSIERCHPVESESDVEERTDGELLARFEPSTQVFGEGVVVAGEQDAFAAPDGALGPRCREA